MNDEQKPIPVEDGETPAEQTAQAGQSVDPSALLKQIEELTNISKRAMADLANYRKRVEEEKSQFVKFTTGGVFLEILPLYDSLDRAVSQIPDDIKENEWVKGIVNIKKQFEQTMERAKILKMKTVGEKFDPNFHEAVTQGPGEKDIIIEELESGYTIEGQTLRPARVKVGSGGIT
ncbi:nucleotide exchange factor GrpE [Candidatus Peregrinibacteria bacterium]|nr:nucleotide exchange factor GrpE [Candidatus Peregrinibacteria bacterium]